MRETFDSANQETAEIRKKVLECAELEAEAARKKALECADPLMKEEWAKVARKWEDLANGCREVQEGRAET
jgi:hypothetical protein